MPLFLRCNDVFDRPIDKAFKKVKKAHFIISLSYQRNYNFNEKQIIQMSLNHGPFLYAPQFISNWPLCPFYFITTMIFKVFLVVQFESLFELEIQNSNLCCSLVTYYMFWKNKCNLSNLTIRS